MQPGSTPSTGEYFGRYRLERRIGHGGMGVVYEAYDPTLERTVALKVLHANLNDTDDYRARFEREAAVLARIRSRHIVQVYDSGSQADTIFLVTEYLPDGDLHQLLRRDGVLPRLAALTLVAQITEGLADAHRAGVLHRDVKPSNVLLWKREEGPIPYLCDFGIATDGTAGLTQTGAIVGSLGYMAPERHLGRSADVRGDVYSVGCLLWATLAGSAPYTGTDFQIAHAHINDEIPQLTGQAAIDTAINAILRDAMAKDPAARIATADELRRRLLAAAREHAADPLGLEPAVATAAPAAPPLSHDGTAVRATPIGADAAAAPPFGGGEEPETMLRPLRAEEPELADEAPRRSARRWLPLAVAVGVLVLVGGGVGAVLAATSGGGKPSAQTSHSPSHSPSTTPTPTPTPTPATTPATTAPPPAPKKVALTPSTACAPYSYRGRQLACRNYDIHVSGFPAGSTQKVTVHSCFAMNPCTDKLKLVPVGADGTGTLKDGIQRAYAGYVLTVRAGRAGTAISVS